MRIALAIAALVLVGFVAVTGTASAAALPSSIKKVMDGPRYRTASWSLYAADVVTGRPLYSLHANRRSFTGSTRKLMSVGLALDELGANARQTTTSGRRLAYALMVNDVGAIEHIESGVSEVFQDEAEIANSIYEERR